LPSRWIRSRRAFLHPFGRCAGEWGAESFAGGTFSGVADAPSRGLGLVTLFRC
jgi:hypothetical protein